MYGEGRQAFQRLQQELATRDQYVDTTLFVWGNLHDNNYKQFPAEELYQTHSGFCGSGHANRFLLAPSPRSFRDGPPSFYTPASPPTSILQPYPRRQCPQQVLHLRV